jgi:hypothetical protein
MVRECRPPAREPVRSWLGRRPTMATSTPANANPPANISPVGPPPAITTASSVIATLPPDSSTTTRAFRYSHFRRFWLRPELCGTTGGLKQAPGALYIGSGKEGATKIGLDAKAALSELEADDLVVQAKAPAGATSSTASGFAARALGVPG